MIKSSIKDLLKFYKKKDTDFDKAYVSMANCRKFLDEVIKHVSKYNPELMNKLEKLDSEMKELYFYIQKEHEKAWEEFYILLKLKEFQDNLHKFGKFKENEEINLEKIREKGILAGFKIFKVEKGGIPVRIEIGEIKITKDERLCYCIDENYLEEFEKTFNF